MTWNGVVHIMEEVQFPQEYWHAAEAMWQDGNIQALLDMLNRHVLDGDEDSCRALTKRELRQSFPATPEYWAMRAARRLVDGTRNCPPKLLAWTVARLLESEIERRQEELAREVRQKFREPPFSGDH